MKHETLTSIFDQLDAKLKHKLRLNSEAFQSKHESLQTNSGRALIDKCQQLRLQKKKNALDNFYRSGSMSLDSHRSLEDDLLK